MSAAEDGTPFPTTVEYDSDEFGAPVNVRINGQRVTGVRRTVVEHDDEEFSVVTLVIGGVQVIAGPKPRQEKP